MEVEPFEAVYPVMTWDVGPDGCATAPAILRFMQEAAIRHAEILGVGFADLAVSSLFWGISRLTMRIHNLPKRDDAVRLRTWPSGNDRLFFYRRFELEGNRGPVVSATTAWIVIDAHRRRHVTAANAPFSVPRGNVEEEAWKPIKVPRPGVPKGETDWLSVNGRHLDLVGHANHICYAEWMIDSLDWEFQKRHRLAGLHINWLSETHAGDRIASLANRGEDGVYDHLLYKPDGVFACSGRTEWMGE